MAYGRDRRPRLNDTSAVVREGINPPGAKVAPFGGNLAYGCGAENAVERRNLGQFRRETGAGAEGLGGACEELEK